MNSSGPCPDQASDRCWPCRLFQLDGMSMVILSRIGNKIGVLKGRLILFRDFTGKFAAYPDWAG